LYRVKTYIQEVVRDLQEVLQEEAESEFWRFEGGKWKEKGNEGWMKVLEGLGLC